MNSCFHFLVVGIEIPDEFGGIKLEEFVSSISRDDGLRVLKLCDGASCLPYTISTQLVFYFCLLIGSVSCYTGYRIITSVAH